MKRILMLSTSLTLLLISTIAMAMPGIPNRFHGNVNFINGPAPDGILVETKVDGVTVASTTTTGGTYGFAPNTFDMIDPDNTMAGKNISFFVVGLATGKTATFINGESSTLDLTANAYVNEIPLAQEIRNRLIVVSPNSPAKINIAGKLFISITSLTTTVANIHQVSALGDGFYGGEYAPPAGQNLMMGYEIDISGEVNITATMNYDALGFDEGTVKSYQFNGKWVEMPMSKDTSAHTITFTITSAHTPYALFAALTPTTTGGGGSGGPVAGGRSAIIQTTSTTTATLPAQPPSNPPYQSSATNQTQSYNVPTGMFLGVSTATWTGILIALAMITGAALLYMRSNEMYPFGKK
ncbi:hypothetical protein EPN87_00015 [archaeon]|nr:MAG: hypothetical protein EPN87_00015 [archaeon]